MFSCAASLADWRLREMDWRVWRSSGFMLTGLRKTAALALQAWSRLAKAGVHVQRGFGQATESRRRPLSFATERPPHAAEGSVGWLPSPTFEIQGDWTRRPRDITSNCLDK